MSSLRHRFPGARDGWARFDGPAGTQVVDSAITAMTNWLSDGSNGCGGGYFAAALKADELMERARATVGRLFNADPAGMRVRRQHDVDHVRAVARDRRHAATR